MNSELNNNTEASRTEGKTSLWSLYITCFRVGIMTFGGGYAMLPMMQREFVEKKGWATDEQMADYYAIAQCTPGVIAVNTSTFIGTRLRGIPGAVAGTLGMITPSILIILVIAAFFSNFGGNPIVRHAFNGVRAAVVVLIFFSVARLAKKSITDLAAVLIMAGVLAASLFTHISPVICVIAAAAAGLIIRSASDRRKAGNAAGEKPSAGREEDEPK